MKSYSLSHNVTVIFEFCSVGKKTGSIELHESDIGVPADDRFLWRWMLSLKDETLIISKSNKPPWYSSKPPELFYFTLQRPEMTSV